MLEKTPLYSLCVLLEQFQIDENTCFLKVIQKPGYTFI